MWIVLGSVVLVLLMFFFVLCFNLEEGRSWYQSLGVELNDGVGCFGLVLVLLSLWIFAQA